MRITPGLNFSTPRKINISRILTVKPENASNFYTLHTALRNHMRIVFDEMSSWTPLTMYLGMKTIFHTKYKM